MNVENRCVEIKATLQKLTDVKNPTARLVAVLMACGVTATSELAELVGVGERAIQKARKLLPQANEETRTTVRSEPQFANHSSPPEPQFAQCEPEFAASRTHAPAQMESPSEIDSSKEVEVTPFTPKLDFWGRPAFGEKDVHFDGSKLTLTEAERADWLPKFGDAERLELALTQAAAFVQVNSRRPLLVQVRAQLARAAGDKIDRDQRYAAAAKAKPVAQATRPKSWVDDRNERARALMAKLKHPEATA